MGNYHARFLGGKGAEKPLTYPVGHKTSRSELMEPHWTGYVGMVAGVVGAITGIAHPVMGYVAYRRSNQIEASDRRLELHKLLNETHVAADGLLHLLSRALASRQSTLSMRGLGHSPYSA